jgi:phage tail sheath protein FI
MLDTLFKAVRVKRLVDIFTTSIRTNGSWVVAMFIADELADFNQCLESV